jgi:hypothetical protein
MSRFDRIDQAAYSNCAPQEDGAKGANVTTSKPSEQEAGDAAQATPEMCPYWHQVVADFAAMYPAGGYCIAGCHKKVKVMADKTVQEVCAMNFGECEGYQRVLAEEEAKIQNAPDTLRR